MAGCVWVGSDICESDEICRSLAREISGGIVCCKAILEDGSPKDFACLMANEAFVGLIGGRDVTGKKMSEVMPESFDAISELFERHARVSMTDRSERVERPIELRKEWFAVSAYSPKPEHFIAVFDVVQARTQTREQRLTNIYHALSATNEAIFKLKSPCELFPHVCRIAVEYGGMIHSWIGVPDDDGWIIPQGRFGKFSPPPQTLSLSICPDRPEGRGPSGIAFRENRPVVVNDMLGNELLAPWRDMAARNGVKSLAVYPITRGGKPYAVFSVYSDRPGIFDPEIASLLDGMARNISFALDNFDREAMQDESEARFERLADAMPQLVWTADPDGKMDYCNQRQHDYSKISKAGSGDLNWSPILHPDDVEYTIHAWQSAVKTAGSYQIEHRLQMADGSYRWHISRAVPVMNEQGHTIKWYGTATDVHDLKMAQKTAQRSKELLLLAQQIARIGTFEWNLLTNEIAISSEMEALHGISPGAAEGTYEAWLKHLHPDDLPLVEQKIREAMTSGALEAEWRIIRPDGAIRWMTSRAQVFRDDSGQPIRMVGINMDITEQKKAEEEMAELSMQRQLALDAACLGWWHYDLDTRTISYDKRYQEMYGLREPEPSLPEFIARLHPDDFPKMLSSAKLATDPDNPKPYRVEYRNVMPDGSLRWIEAHGMGIFAGTGKDRRAVRLAGTAADITKRKQDEEQLRESEEKFRALVEGAADAYFVHDISGKIIEVNRMACESLGYTRDELLTMFVTDVDETYRPERAKQFWSQPDLDTICTLESSHRRKDGSRFSVEVRIRSVTINSQKCFIALVRDITERKESEEALKLAAMVYQDSSEAMIVFDADNRIVAVNPAFEYITGFQAQEAIGEHTDTLFASSENENFSILIDAALRSDGFWKGELWSTRKNGSRFALSVSINTGGNPDGSANRRVMLFSDITEKKESDKLIWNQANFDALTGLPNRHFFRERLRHEILNAKRSKLSLALMLLDLDGFKSVNDTLGHDMGDLLLKEATERLRNSVRESDTVARLGGDEFTVILTELEPESVDRIARHILRSLSEPVQLGVKLAHVSASIGIALFPSDSLTIEELIRNADQAMYSAKQEGKNRYHYFTPAMQEAALKRIRVINDMRGALDARQFEIVYQPVVELSSGTIQKAEALIRWNHPMKGVISPLEFISAAEDSGMISSFGNWVFHEAARQAAIWRERYHSGFQICVNLSPVQFKTEGIDSSLWFRHLRDLGLPGQGIIVEITEKLLLDADSKVRDQLAMLREAGIEVALDNFGTGYSSLSYLKHFLIDYIKLDHAFVRDLSRDTYEMALCDGLILMAHKLNIKVIAEGVEEGRQHELLANGGCDFAQGYHFSRPISAEKFEHLLEAAPFSTQETLEI